MCSNKKSPRVLQLEKACVLQQRDHALQRRSSRTKIDFKKERKKTNDFKAFIEYKGRGMWKQMI